LNAPHPAVHTLLDTLTCTYPISIIRATISPYLTFFLCPRRHHDAYILFRKEKAGELGRLQVKKYKLRASFVPLVLKYMHDLCRVAKL